MYAASVGTGGFTDPGLLPEGTHKDYRLHDVDDIAVSGPLLQRLCRGCEVEDLPVGRRSQSGNSAAFKEWVHDEGILGTARRVHGHAVINGPR